MRRKKIVYVFALIATYSCSCGGFSDLTEHMGGGYSYRGEGEGSNVICYSEKLNSKTSIDSIIVYPDVKQFVYDDEFILVKQKPNLKGHVIELSAELSSITNAFRFFDSLPLNQVPHGYIEAVKENENKVSFYRELVLKTSPNNSLEDQLFFEKMADSIIKNNPLYNKMYHKNVNYWIINKSRKVILGPLSKNEYLKKKKEIGISEKLSMD
jgi:hypothetical protein